MKLRKCCAVPFYILILIFLFSSALFAQSDYRTLLPMEKVKAMINEVSGTVPHNIMNEIAAFNHDRKAAEYENTYLESQIVVKYAKEFGFSGINIERFKGRQGGPVRQWDAEQGELWLLTPEEKLIISHRDIPAALASGSGSADVTTELVYAGPGDKESDYAGKDVAGKIVLVSGARSSWGGAARSAYRMAVGKFNAKGVVAFRTPNPYDRPDQVPWASIRNAKESTFAFNLPFRIGNELRNRLEAGEKLKVRAVVKTKYYDTDYEIPAAVIQGTGETDEEVCIVAHLFEGVTKQGANDNISGCVAILEAGRMLNRLIEKGIIDRPKRTIRFLWVPEIMGTYQYFENHPEEVKKMIAGLNMDMVGEDIKKNRNLTHLIITPHSLMSFINDVAAHYFDFVSKISHNPLPPEGRRPFSLPITDPTGSRDPFLYKIVSMPVGGSDHMILQMPKYKVPCIFYNNWPDMHYHASDDRPDKSDPTQLKRISFLIGIVSYAVADGGPENVPAFLNECLARGGARIENDLKECLNEMIYSNEQNLPDVYKEQKYKISSAFKREQKNINSLLIIGKNDTSSENLIKEMGESFMQKEVSVQNLLKTGYKNICDTYNIKPVEPELTDLEKTASKMVPANVNISGSIFGMRGTGLPRKYTNELLLFIDGKLSILDLRNAVSAEYGPVELEKVSAFFEDMQKKKMLEIIRK